MASNSLISRERLDDILQNMRRMIAGYCSSVDEESSIEDCVHSFYQEIVVHNCYLEDNNSTKSIDEETETTIPNAASFSRELRALFRSHVPIMDTDMAGQIVQLFYEELIGHINNLKQPKEEVEEEVDATETVLPVKTTRKRKQQQQHRVVLRSDVMGSIVAKDGSRRSKRLQGNSKEK